MTIKKPVPIRISQVKCEIRVISKLHNALAIARRKPSDVASYSIIQPEIYGSREKSPQLEEFGNGTISHRFVMKEIATAAQLYLLPREINRTNRLLATK